MKSIKEYVAANATRLLLAVAIVAAAGFGVIDPATAAIGAIVVGDTNPGDLTKLEKAMKDAFARMEENVRKVQEVADNALAESKKLGGTIESKTNEKLTEIGAAGNKIAEEVKTLKDQVVDLHQKYGTRPGGSGEEAKLIYEIVTASEEFKRAKATKGAREMQPVVVGNFHKHWEKLIQAQKTQIINATGQNQPLVPADRRPGIITPAEQRLFIRDLLPQSPTDTNLIEFTSEATFTNNARPQGDASPGGIEGEVFAESAMTFTLSNAPVITIGHWIPASRQVLADATLLQGHIGTRLIYGLKLEEETEILRGDGTAGKLNGINNQAAAFSYGSTNQTILDTLLEAILQVSLSNYELSGFVLHPIDWTNAIMLKDTTNRYLFANPQDMVAPRVWSKPVVATATQTLGKFTGGAFSLGAQIWDREDATVRISENVDNHFVKNMVAILAEERVGLTVYRTSSFVYGNVSHAG